MKNTAALVVAWLKNEPVRVRLYAIGALVVTFLVAQGKLSPDDYQFYLSAAALVLGVETARAKVSPAS